jgi:hypothetical protein
MNGDIESNTRNKVSNIPAISDGFSRKDFRMLHFHNHAQKANYIKNFFLSRKDKNYIIHMHIHTKNHTTNQFTIATPRS